MPRAAPCFQRPAVGAVNSPFSGRVYCQVEPRSAGGLFITSAAAGGRPAPGKAWHTHVLDSQGRPALPPISAKIMRRDTQHDLGFCRDRGRYRVPKSGLPWRDRYGRIVASKYTLHMPRNRNEITTEPDCAMEFIHGPR